MTVKVHQLIAHLMTLDQEMPVAYRCYSDFLELELDEIDVMRKCKARPDGVIQAERPDKETEFWLVFPGN